MYRKLSLILSALVGLLLVLFSYQHLYDNEFHFDDSHTIQDNPYVRDISNIPKFFTLGSVTFSSLPTNQVYRPIVTSSIAIDYYLSKKYSKTKNGYDVHFYHYSMMLTYILLLALLFAFFLKIFDTVRPHDWNVYFALFAAIFFGVHTVNAETINYIISRSDLLSTFFVIAAFDTYLYFPKARKWGFFLLFFVLGVFTKLTAAMFIPLLLTYYYLFEYLPLGNVERKQRLRRILVQASLLVLLMLLLVVFVLKMQSDTFVPSNHSRWQYLITMPFVLLHYFISFFYPYNLSADTDWTVIDSIINWRFFVGISFIGFMLWALYKTYRKRLWAPVSFGIVWFFVALAPTSSFIPLAEVLNDHRMFYPFVGLTFAVVYLLSIWIVKKEYYIRQSVSYQLGLGLFIVVVLGLHSYGVRRRTAVWDNGKSLWYDVSIKSPKNGRGLMNYGLQLMSDGDYNGAMKYYKKALKYSPYYPYLFTNIALCNSFMLQNAEAEKYFKLSLKYGYYSHKTHYYYGSYLLDNKRYGEAIKEFNISLEMAPKYIYSQYKLMQAYAAIEDWEKLKKVVALVQKDFPNDVTASYYAQLSYGKMTKLQLAKQQVKNFPGAASYIELSLQYYRANKYDSSIYAATKALKYKSENLLAYNNICAANNVLGNWDAAIAAGEQALTIDPKNQLAKNNLAISHKRKKLQQQLDNENNADKLIDLSLQFYKERMYNRCVEACRKALLVKPGNALAYNNICSAYNAMGEWDKAVIAGKKAVKYAPTWQRAKNNLSYAQIKLKEGQ